MVMHTGRWKPDAWVDAGEIQPPHAVRDEVCLAALTNSMLRCGWQGRPILVQVGLEGEYYGWTGSHRLAAACKIGMRVPVIHIAKDLEDPIRGGVLDPFYLSSFDDTDKYVLLVEAGDKRAARLMQIERLQEE